MAGSDATVKAAEEERLAAQAKLDEARDDEAREAVKKELELLIRAAPEFPAAPATGLDAAAALECLLARHKKRFAVVR